MGRFDGRKCLVTGGAGFIGANLVKALVNEGAQVAVIDDLFTGKEENIADVLDKIDFFKLSVACDNAVKYQHQTDFIFHLACRNIIVSTAEPELDFDVNARGTFNMLLLARKLKAKLIYASSASVYGNPRHLPIDEDCFVYTLSPYSASKVAGEAYCIAFKETYNLPVVILRYSNVYGPWQRPDNPYCGVVAKFFDSTMKGGLLAIHGNGRQTRDFTFVDDCIEATLLAALNERANGEVFNIGTGVEISVMELAELVVKNSKDYDQAKAWTTYVTYINRRDIDNISRRCLNIEKARRVLNWVPMVGLEDGLIKTYQWLVNGMAV